MAKRFYLIRHAKSSWSNPSLMDVERPLNERGKRDAPFMAEKLYELDPSIELMISSPAKRAMKTAQQFSNQYFGEQKIVSEEDLYHASTDDIMEVINDVKETYSTIAVFGHNPGFTYVANLFADEYIDNVPTCGIVGVESNASTWEELNIENCKVIRFIYPKLYQD